MTDIALLFLTLDATSEARWREPLSTAAEAAGWEVCADPAPADFDRSGRIVVISRDVNWATLFPPSSCWVMTGGDLPEFNTHSPSLIDRHAVFQSSINLVVATHLLERDATLVDRRTTVLNVPGVGSIESIGVVDPVERRSPLGVYRNLPPQIGAAATWPAELFSFGEAAFEPGEPEIDLTGRARIVVHGPYVHLPTGRWKATIQFTVEAFSQAPKLRVEWGSAPSFAALETEISVSGVYELSLEHEWLAPGPAQVVVWLAQPIFEGRLVFGGCRVEKIADLALPVLPDADEAVGLSKASDDARDRTGGDLLTAGPA